MDSAREMVRIAGKTSCRLPADQQFGQLRMTFVKFRIIGGDFFIRAIAFSSLLNLYLAKPISRSTSLGSAIKRFFHLGSAKSSNALGSSSFLTRLVFQPVMIDVQVGREPEASLHAIGVFLRFGESQFHQQLLIVRLHHVVEIDL